MSLNVDDLEQMLATKSFTPAELRQTVDQVEFLHPWQPGDPFPLGIVAPDALRVRVSTEPEKIGSLLNDLTLAENGLVRSWKVFPIGIVAPERFEVDIELGRRFAR